MRKKFFIAIAIMVLCIFALGIIHSLTSKKVIKEELAVAIVTQKGENPRIKTFNKSFGKLLGKELNRKISLKYVSALAAHKNKKSYDIIIGLDKKSSTYSSSYLYVPNELVTLKSEGISNLSHTPKKFLIMSNIDYPKSLTLSDIKLNIVRMPSASAILNSVMMHNGRGAIVSILDFNELSSKNIDYLENLKTNQTTPPLSSQTYYIYINDNFKIEKAFKSLQNSQKLAKLSFRVLGQDYTKQ